MTLEEKGLSMTESIDLDQILATVGPALKVQYNKPHCYPMAAPTFSKCRGFDRPRPSGPYSVYLHIPFCNYHCSFCTYATRQGARLEQMQRYVQAIKNEASWIEPGSTITELYVGGGTPTTLSPALLDDALFSITRSVNFAPDAVNTVECSPESITPEHLTVTNRHDINRLSMGIQSLDDEVLIRLCRNHDGREAVQACKLLVASGAAVNVDLIYGLPGQSPESFAQDFETVAACGVDSVTVYNLRTNEKTPVAGILGTEEQLELPRLVEWRIAVRDTAMRLGFTQTRWHTFVRKESHDTNTHEVAPGVEDTRNRSEEIGIGQSARSRLGNSVYRNHTLYSAYLQRAETGRSPVEEVFDLTTDEQKTLFIGKTLGDGHPLDRHSYQEKFGNPVEVDYPTQLEQLHACGLIDSTPERVSLSETGKLVFDLVTWMFYPQHSQEWIAARQNLNRPKEPRRTVA